MKFDTPAKLFLAHVAKSIETDGWVSRGKARTTGNVATVDLVASEADTFSAKDAAPYAEAVGAAIKWATTRAAKFDDLNDYEAKAVASILTPTAKGWVLRENINPRGVGFAGSVVYVAKRDEAHDAARRKLAKSATGGHYGNVGEKFTISNVRVVEVRHLAKWDCHLHKFLTSDGNILTWMTKRRVGDVNTRLVRLSGTVKAHRTWDAIPETQVTRCKYIAA